MGDVSKMTSKGQVTVPLRVRNALKLDDESYIDFEIVGKYAVIKKAEIRMREIQKILESSAKRKKITKPKTRTKRRMSSTKTDPSGTLPPSGITFFWFNNL